jgi:regulator of protease activity HflC (stomatin/prohibitin superfamily)
MKKILLNITVILLMISSCAVVNPGEVGVKQKFGEIKGPVRTQGLVLVNPLITELVIVPTRTVNKEIGLNLPSKEGLNVAAEISILYHVKEGSVIDIINDVGLSYERTLILSTFRSASADICAKFFAKDMHSGKRAQIESEIKDQMITVLAGRGFVIESILLKSIKLPRGLYSAIESKLEAEQQAQQMEFVLQREIKEAERKRIEAAGIRDAQNIIKEGITDANIQWKSLEVLRELSSSPNAKIIITDGKTPVLINND